VLGRRRLAPALANVGPRGEERVEQRPEVAVLHRRDQRLEILDQLLGRDRRAVQQITRLVLSGTGRAQRAHGQRRAVPLVEREDALDPDHRSWAARLRQLLDPIPDDGLHHAGHVAQP